MRDRETKSDLRRIIATLRAELASTGEERLAARREVGEVKREIETLTETYRKMTAERDAQIKVLQSDRDRLTTAVEVLSRRIVSPAAERDVTRAGWRYAMEQAPK